MKTVTLFQLNEYIRRILALNLPDALWIQCEIAQVNESRGHCFLELVQKSEAEENIVAQASAVIWQNYLRLLRRKIGVIFDQLLREGMEVLLKARVDYNERYGFKLIIEDIDPTYTLGKLELKRRQTLDVLRQQGLLEKQRFVPLPVVLQRVAIISSERAAGYQDFLQQLQQNTYGYQFQLRFFQSAMQGDLVEAEMLKQLNAITKTKENFDCIVIIRGGGARLDLNAFDNFKLCKAVAACELPVLTGIGHDVDETVLDLVAHSALKTPTAVADFIINRNVQFESHIVHLGMQLKSAIIQKVNNQRFLLNNLINNIQFRLKNSILQQQQQLHFIQSAVPRQAHHRFQFAKQNLDSLEKMTQLLSVPATLQRGFALIEKKGHLVRSTTKIQSGDELTIQLADGKFTGKAD